jgi:luciferase family oxidoreductase group 1
MSDQDPLPLSVLDLASVQEGKTIADAFANSLALARHAESLGYERFWMAEHHNISGIASSATAVLLAHVAGGTKRIRVGSGGIMLPNHSPLVIAEQFGTLETLFPGRIDLGLGRAPGTDRTTMRALRREMTNLEDDFSERIQELQEYLAHPTPDQKVIAIPGANLDIPIWILGSSIYSAQLAAALGLPYSFAGHFAPDQMLQALEIYYQAFVPSKTCKEPHSMICVQALAADTDARANFLATSLYQRVLGIIRNQRTLTRPPVEQMDLLWSEDEKAAVESIFRYSLIGGPETIAYKMERLLEITRADELMLCTEAFDLKDRMRSFEITMKVANG